MGIWYWSLYWMRGFKIDEDIGEIDLDGIMYDKREDGDDVWYVWYEWMCKKEIVLIWMRSSM